MASKCGEGLPPVFPPPFYFIKKLKMEKIMTEILRNNTCPNCGHYSSSHDDKGCTILMMGIRCTCNLNHELLKELQEIVSHFPKEHSRSTDYINYTRENYIYDFKQVVQEMIDLTSRKNNDYGGPTDPWKNFREFGELGILVRMGDKWARIKTQLWEKRTLQVNDETVEDTIKDLAVYSIILLLWRKVHSDSSKDTQNEGK